MTVCALGREAQAIPSPVTRGSLQVTPTSVFFKPHRGSNLHQYWEAVGSDPKHAF